MRTLGFAYCEVEKEEFEKAEVMTELFDKLELVGVVAIADPVRPTVPAAIRQCVVAGIDVKMVTGDTSVTAVQIAKEVGLIAEGEALEGRVITGPEFAALSDDEVLELCRTLKVIARARPLDKERLVKALQAKEEVVAVTGDGTNDAPALNAAQVGLSMGDGTSVAKEASDITILDNSFDSIVNAVMWGRSLYKNIQRFILFQLTINVAASLIVLIGAFTGEESPLTVTQMLWVNLIMDTFAAIALASLPPSRTVLNEKPRRMHDFIIGKKMGQLIFGVGIAFVVALFGLLFWMKADGGLDSRELTVFFTTFVMLQFWNMFNAKAFMTGSSAFAALKDSKGFMWMLVVILLGQIFIVNLGGDLFNVSPISLKDWGMIIASTSVVMIIGEIGRVIASNIKR
jgi:Ca2+-transporting ATPase